MLRWSGVACVVAALGVAACGDAGETRGTPVVVVTYSALESIVADIVGDSARVEVIVPNGTDPHDFEPSAKDVEAISDAVLVVANGLDLEEGLADALDEAEKSGVPIFRLTDHVALRDGNDPHVWLDPMTLASAIPALGERIGARIDVDLSDAGREVVADLERLDQSIAARIGSLDSCVVITGHESLGYFGARYGCKVLGSIIPGFSSAAEATAQDLSGLKSLAESEGVKAIFTELGTPGDVADQLASEVGVEVVELATHLVPDGGGYDDMMSVLADAIVGGLS